MVDFKWILAFLGMFAVAYEIFILGNWIKAIFFFCGGMAMYCFIKVDEIQYNQEKILKKLEKLK